MSRKIQVRLHRLDELNLHQFDALDREKTIALLPVGMLEIHGGHLPLGTDTFAVDALTLSAAAWLLENDPDLEILLMPTIPYGTDPLDLRRADLFERAGSVWLSRETLKAVVGDVLRRMLHYGFRGAFPVGFHGGADQSIVLEELCEELRTEYPDSVIVEPVGYVLGGAGMDVMPGIATLLGRPLTQIEEVGVRNSVHASMMETSMMLHLRPDLVDPSYTTLRTVEWREVYNHEDWPGYIGASPARASAEIGAAALRWRGVRTGWVIKEALRGEPVTELPRHPVYDDSGPTPEDLQAPPPPNKVSIDSNPVVQISREQLEEAREKRESARSEDTTVVAGESRTVIDQQPVNRQTPPAESDSADSTS